MRWSSASRSAIWRSAQATVLPQNANTITLASSFLYDGLTVNINAGSTGRIKAVVLVTSPVPEPATWAMMLLGFGMIGATARYRHRHSKVIYAGASLTRELSR